MSRKLLLTRVPALAVLAALTIPATASAAPAASPFHRTYPAASRLCARVAAGHVPARLKGHEAQVGTACTALEGVATSARAHLKAAVQARRAALRSARQAVVAACRKPRDRATCVSALRAARHTLRDVRRSFRAALRSHRHEVRAGRRAFWSALKAL
jgi:hypothetical protein